MDNRPSMTPEEEAAISQAAQPPPPPAKAKVRMVKNDQGVLVPEDQKCQHLSILKRLKPKMDKYNCKAKDGGCGESVNLVVNQFMLLTDDEFAALQKAQEEHIKTRNRQKLGLVTPGEAAEVNRQQQRGRKAQ